MCGGAKEFAESPQRNRREFPTGGFGTGNTLTFFQASVLHPRGVVRSKQRGFSLLELLVVLVIAGILLAWGYPRLATLANSYRLDGAAWRLVTELQKVRLRAVAEGTPLRVVFDTAARTYRIQKQTPSGSWVDDGPARSLDDLGRLSVALSPAGRSPTFTPRGVVESGTEVVVQLAAPTGGQRLVFVQVQGRIYVR